MALSKMGRMLLEDLGHIASTLEANQKALVQGLTEEYKPFLQPGETLPDFQLLNDLEVRRLRSRMTELRTKDENHTTEEGQDETARIANKTATDEAYEALRNTKEALRSKYGSEGLRVVKLADTTPTTPSALEQELSHLVQQLQSGSLSWPTVRNPLLNNITDQDFLNLCLKPYQQLNQSKQNLERELSESAVTRTERQEEMVVSQGVKRTSLLVGEGQLLVAGLTKAAEILRPSTNSRGKKKDNGEEVTPTETATPETTSSATN